MNVTPDDIEQLASFIDLLLLSFGFFALVLGVVIGWYVRGRYESWYWLKHGVYCDKCAPLINSVKGDGQ